MDPRFIKVKLDSLPTTFTPIVSVTNNRVSSLSIQISGPLPHNTILDFYLENGKIKDDRKYPDHRLRCSM